MKHNLFIFKALLLALLLGLGHLAHAQKVGIGTTAPTQMLDVNGNLRVRGLSGSGAGRLLSAAADGTLQAQQPVLGATLAPGAGRVVVLNADGSLGSLDPTQLPGYERRAVALGSVGSSGTLYATSSNYTVAHPATGSYRLTFSAASGLTAQDLSTATVAATLFNTPGLVSCRPGTGYVDVFTFDPTGAAADRGFSFSVLLP
jgi:hypothetical protein